MASGDTLVKFIPAQNNPPETGYATLDTRNNHLVLDFDAATAEDAIFPEVLPRHYTGLGITATVVWMASTAITGSIRLEGSFERHQDETDDLDADSFAAAQGVTSAAPAVSGTPQYAAIVFTNAQIDGLLVGESFRFRLRRAAADVADDMAGDAELLRIELKET